MNTVMIHSCNSRLWYVKQFLIPQFEAKGTEIILWNDDNGNGCLRQFVASARYIKEHFGSSGGMWHAQDDILLSERFPDYEFGSDNIVNAFVSKFCNTVNYKRFGAQPVKNYWMSFPLMYIPNLYMSEFFDWFVDKCIIEKKHQSKVAENKFDDFLFWQFMKDKHNGDTIINNVPNLAQHIDYAIGGTTINQNHPAKVRAYYWKEYDYEQKFVDMITEGKHGTTAKAD